MVGRDALCHEIIEDLRDPITRRPHVVIGGMGAGKTALLVRLAGLLAERGAIPVPSGSAMPKKPWISASSRASDSSPLALFLIPEGEEVWRERLPERQVVILADWHGGSAHRGQRAGRAPQPHPARDPPGDCAPTAPRHHLPAARLARGLESRDRQAGAAERRGGSRIYRSRPEQRRRTLAGLDSGDRRPAPSCRCICSSPGNCSGVAGFVPLGRAGCAGGHKQHGALSACGCTCWTPGWEPYSTAT